MKSYRNLRIILIVLLATVCWSYSEEESLPPAGKRAGIITPPRDLFGLMDSLGQAVDSTYFALPDSVRERLGRSAVEETSWGRLKANLKR